MGTSGAFKDREVEIEGVTASMEPGERQTQGVVRLCTTDPVAFRSSQSITFGCLWVA